MLGNILPPYHSLQELNLDWILTKVKNILRFVPDDGAVGQILRRTAHGAEWSDEQGAGGSVTSVNGQQGAVVLTAADVGALPDSYVAPVTSVNGQTGAVSLSIPDSTSDLVNDSGFVDAAGAAAAAPVQSVNGQTGAVTITAPVTSVNGQTGAVSLSIPDSTSDLINDSGFVDAAGAAAAAPVQSVNGQTGAVVIAAGAPTVIVDDTSYVNGTIYEVTKTYTVTGDGAVLVSAAAYSDATSDFGMWQAEIFHNNVLIFGEGTRFAVSYNRSWGASASCPVQVSNGDTIKIHLYNSKTGTISVFRRFMCFGCTVS